ncbi:IPL1 [Symbiodinium sp. CCMP2592]|nr:IPL1 [Symbiodinium sp. CCMP2592]
MLDAQQHKKLALASATLGTLTWIGLQPVDIKGAKRHDERSIEEKLRPADGSRLLVEFKEQFPDGRERETLRLPGTKKEPHENARQTAERILKEMMTIDPSMVSFDFSTVERQEEETDSPSFPVLTLDHGAGVS